MSPTTCSLRIFEDPALLAAAATGEFYRHASNAYGRRRKFSCALSGGATPRLLYEKLAAEAARPGLPAGFWDSMHFFWGDERDVPPDHPDSNFRLAREALFDHIKIPQRNLHRIKPDAGGALAAAGDYERELRRFFGARAGQFPRFDLIFLGMGEDGHTASIFPYSETVREEVRLVAAPWLARLQSFRITLTPAVINNAANVIFLVSGQSKAGTLRKVFCEQLDPDRLPAQSIHLLDGEVLWLVDMAAASSLP